MDVAHRGDAQELLAGRDAERRGPSDDDAVDSRTGDLDIVGGAGRETLDEVGAGSAVGDDVAAMITDPERDGPGSECRPGELEPVGPGGEDLEPARRGRTAVAIGSAGHLAPSDVCQPHQPPVLLGMSGHAVR